MSMAMYPGLPGSGPGSQDDGRGGVGSLPDLSMMDRSMMNGAALDMDMSLPMDLDMDLTQPDQAFHSLSAQSQPQHRPQTNVGGGGGGSTSPVHDRFSNDLTAGNTTSSTPPPEPSTAGAGPLPTGFGQPAPNNTSTLTEFTKRRNWSQRIIEELKDFLHILTSDGRILYVSPSCKAITGYDSHALIGKFIGEYVHPDDSGIFMREFNESIASGNPLRFYYRFKKEDGTYVIFECDGHPHIAAETAASNFTQPAQGTMSAAGLCKGLFMMARPYPTRNAALLDSFLEHKIENERLMRRMTELKREEAEENAEQDQLSRDQVSPSVAPTAVPSESQAVGSRTAGDHTGDVPSATSDYQGMPPPDKPSISNTMLTRQNLDSALSSQRPDSIADKMSRYEANNTHLESIELLTGLRYRDGERSHGISTGDVSPALVRGDAGIAILLDRDRDGSKKEKKKMKVADEYVCADCGTLDSPEWRKGPKGPKTLCNACGLRWAKKEKKRSGDDKTESSSAGGMAPGASTPGMIPGHSMPPGMPMNNSTSSS